MREGGEIGRESKKNSFARQMMSVNSLLLP